MMISELFDLFLLNKSFAGLSPKSIYDYRCFIQPFVDQFNMPIEYLDLDHVFKYISSLYDRTISRSTLSTYIRNLKIFIRWLCENGYSKIKFDKIKIPKSPKKIVSIYNDDQISMIFQNIIPDFGIIYFRNRAIIALMLDSGIRQSEVSSLLRSNINFADRYLKVFGKGNKERIVPIGNFALKCLKDYFVLLDTDSDFAFLSNSSDLVTADSIKQFMYKISKRLPFEFSSHKLRHNFATNYCLDQYEKYGRIDIYRLMILLGHEDIETTRRYLHIANGIIATREHISHLDQILKN